MRNRVKSIVLGLTVPLLAGCLASFSAQAKNQRILLQLSPERIEDTAENREHYPFLVSAFDQSRDDQKALESMPDALPAEVEFVTVSKEDAKTDKDLAFTFVSAPYYCGTAGCPLNAYALGSTGEHQKLLSVSAHISKSFFLSVCPEYTSVLLVAGHGNSLNWTEWRYMGSEFQRLDAYEDLASLPVCDEK